MTAPDKFVRYGRSTDGGIDTTSLIGKESMSENASLGCPDANTLWHMWCAVLSGEISRQAGAQWAEQWGQSSELDCEEWQTYALEAFTFASVVVDLEGHLLYSDEDLLDWTDDYFPPERFPR